MRGTYVGNNRVLVLPQWGGKLYTPGDDMSMTPALLIDGVIEVGFTNYVLSTVKEGWNIVDVGANIGYFTVLFGLKVGGTGRVHAYEPNQKTLSFLRDNISVNDISRHVNVYEAVVSDTVELVPFYVSQKYQGNSSIIKHPPTYFKQFSADAVTKEEVGSVTLDDHLIQGYTLDLVKIDVEGAEGLVMAGMTQLMRQNKVKRIVFEVNQTMLKPIGARELLDRLLHYKECYGARFFTFQPDGSRLATTLQGLFEKDYTDNVLMELP